jgi:2'-hydroxyisoflavone reductase
VAGLIHSLAMPASLTRREFMLVTAATLATVPVSELARSAEAQSKATKALRILILGGTGFLGPACTESAQSRGHSVTHFNSGRTETLRKTLGRPSVVPADVEQLFGNRDPNKTADDRKTEGKADAPHDPNSPKGLTQLEGKKWDAVIDTSGYFPRMVKASAELLAPTIKQYLFISTISVYKSASMPNADENAPLQTLADPTTEEMGKDAANYGGGKALCEKAAEKAMPGRTTILRPGFIVGPRDTSGRFIYWPVRVSMGGEMIVPGEPSDPIQIIDVRDLAEFIIHCLEENIVGTYNVTGPQRELAMKDMVEGVRQGVGSDANFTWVANDFLDSSNAADGKFPLYAPPTGETAGFHRCNISRALAKGLKFRHVSDTAKATLEWYKSLPTDLQPRIAPQFGSSPKGEAWIETEKRLLAEWHAREQKLKAAR